MWLTATARGLAIQPLTALPYLVARLERGGGKGLSPAQQDQLRALAARYRVLFPARGAEVLLFRIGRADPPSARSLRRHLDQVLELA
jgi:hypothetical protein